VSTRAEEDTFEQYWSTIRHYLRLILGLFLAAEVVILLFLLSATPLYTSSSTILIEPQTPDVLAHDTTPDNSEVGDHSFYTTEWEVLKSRTLAARVIHDLGLTADPAFMGTRTKPSLVHSVSSWFAPLSLAKQADTHRRSAEVATNDDILGVKSGLIDKYLAGLAIKPEYDTRLVIVAYTSTDPVLAARLSNAHAQAYIQHGYELRTRSNETAQRFLEGQLGQLEKRLEKSEAALNDYRRERGIVAFALDDKDRLVSERIAALNKALVDAEERSVALQADVETIKSDNYDAVPEVVNNSLIQELKVDLSRLQGQYANLSTEYTPDYPVVAQLRAQILQVQRREEQEKDRVVASIKASYRAAIDRKEELGKQLEDEKAGAMSLNNASLRDAVLAREVDTNRALYKSVLERIKVLGVASEARLTNVSIIDPASVPQSPSSPKKKLSLVLAGFLALMVGISAAFVLEMRDKGLKTADELEQYLRLPALATVLCFSGEGEARLAPQGLARLPWLIGKSNDKYVRSLRRIADGRQFAESTTAHTGVDETALRQGSFSAAVEAYRAIRTRILLSRPERPPKTILFTSAISGEGKTATAINTAVAFASLLDRVLLIDADLRRGRCHEIMNRKASPGLTEVLSGLTAVEDAIQPTNVKGLFLLGAGSTSPNPSELLGSRKMSDVLALVGSRYEYVLIDSAPLLPVSDSVLLSTLVDGIVVVAGRRTPRQVVRFGCARLGSIGARIVGAVLNSVDLQNQPYYAHYIQYGTTRR